MIEAGFSPSDIAGHVGMSLQALERRFSPFFAERTGFSEKLVDYVLGKGLVKTAGDDGKKAARASSARKSRITKKGKDDSGKKVCRITPSNTKDGLHTITYLDMMPVQMFATWCGFRENARKRLGATGLSMVRLINADEKVIESLIADKRPRLVDMTCEAFAEETASESPAPGGGSVSAYMGALGSALGTMVANLSAHKAGWDDRWEDFSNVADKGMRLQEALLHLVDEDTDAFNGIMNALSMPKGSEEEKRLRAEALEAATLTAARVPLETMRRACEVFEICREMAANGNPASASDAGVGALAARSAVLGAGLNVKINAAGLADKEQAAELVAEANRLVAEAIKAEAEVLDIVNEKIK